MALPDSQEAPASASVDTSSSALGRHGRGPPGAEIRGRDSSVTSSLDQGVSHRPSSLDPGTTACGLPMGPGTHLHLGDGETCTRCTHVVAQVSAARAGAPTWAEYAQRSGEMVFGGGGPHIVGRISKADRGDTPAHAGAAVDDPGEEKRGAHRAPKASPGDSSASPGRADVSTMLRALAAIHGPIGKLGELAVA